MKQLICLLLCSFILYGCYTEKKAMEQVEKAADKFPLQVATVARDMFPCVTTDSTVKEFADSTQYILSRDEAVKKYIRANNSIDSLKAITAMHSEELKNACKEYQEIIDEQATELINMNGIIENFKPVVKWREVTKTVEDNAKIAIVNGEIDKCLRESAAALMKKDNTIEQQAAEILEWKGLAKKRFWLLMLLIGAVAGFIFRKPIGLLFKKIF